MPAESIGESGVLGVILAGGDNRRFGDHKALARLGDRRIIDHVIGALKGAVEEVVVVANDRERYGGLGLETRPDRIPGCGVLGGILTGISWAAERGFRAALVVACDMPFLSAGLLRELAAQATPTAVWLPASEGPRGFEPLCAAYGVECLGEFERAVARGDRAVVSALAGVVRRFLPPESVAAFGDPAILFLNVNRHADRERAEALLARSGLGNHPAER